MADNVVSSNYIDFSGRVKGNGFQQLNKQIIDLQMELNETYIDDNGIIWSRPTAEAYYRVCKARDKWQKKAEGII